MTIAKIKEKLAEIEHDAKKLYHQKPTNPKLGLGQEYRRILAAVQDINNVSEELHERAMLVYDIRDEVGKGGEAVFTVMRVENILKKLP
jgi:hypothetical protein